MSAVFHLGGLDYAFEGATPDERLSIQDLSPVRQAKAWGILQAVAKVGAESPDYQASSIIEVPFPRPVAQQ